LRRTLHVGSGNAQIRAECFNLFNRPNLANPDGLLGAYNQALAANSIFGVSTRTAANAPPVGVTTGLAPLYRAGGPRSIQLSLRVAF